jgi:hypothetical protein
MHNDICFSAKHCMERVDIWIELHQAFVDDIWESHGLVLGMTVDTLIWM